VPPSTPLIEKEVECTALAAANAKAPRTPKSLDVLLEEKQKKAMQSAKTPNAIPIFEEGATKPTNESASTAIPPMTVQTGVGAASRAVQSSPVVTTGVSGKRLREISSSNAEDHLPTKSIAKSQRNGSLLSVDGNQPGVGNITNESIVFDIIGDGVGDAISTHGQPERNASMTEFNHDRHNSMVNYSNALLNAPEVALTLTEPTQELPLHPLEQYKPLIGVVSQAPPVEVKIVLAIAGVKETAPGRGSGQMVSAGGKGQTAKHNRASGDPVKIVVDPHHQRSPKAPGVTVADHPGMEIPMNRASYSMSISGVDNVSAGTGRSQEVHHGAVTINKGQVILDSKRSGMQQEAVSGTKDRVLTGGKGTKSKIVGNKDTNTTNGLQGVQGNAWGEKGADAAKSPGMRGDAFTRGASSPVGRKLTLSTTTTSITQEFLNHIIYLGKLGRPVLLGGESIGSEEFASFQTELEAHLEWFKLHASALIASAPSL